MKKLHITVIFIFIFSIGFAQISSHQFSKFKVSQEKVNAIRIWNAARDTNNIIGMERYNFAFKLDSILGGIASVSTAYLWPDTSVFILNPDSSIATNSIFAIGECINPSSVYFNMKPKNEKCVPEIYLDTIGFYCLYDRVPALATAVDTLVVQIKKGVDDQFFWEQSQNPWVMYDYGTDTLLYKGIYHDAGQLISSRPGYVTWKFPLDASSANDTLPNGINYFRIPLYYDLGIYSYYHPTYYPLTLSISFIPGFSWNANADTIQNLNRLRFISFEENGDGGGAGTLPSYTKRDWNASYILYKDKFMNDSIYTPSYYFDDSYTFEHHWIDFIMRLEQTGSINTKSSTLKDIKLQPNPFSEDAVLSFSIDNASEVSIGIYDLSGALLQSYNMGIQSQGQHQFIVEGNQMESGLYFYVIKAAGETKTGKMVLVR